MQSECPSFTLVAGVGNYAEGKACVMSAEVARWRFERGEPIGEMTDELDCACPVLRRALIVANDSKWWRDNAERTAIMGRWLGHIAGTRDDSKVMSRVFALADAAVRVDAADALEAAGFAEEAVKLRNLSPVVDAQSAERAARAARAAATAAGAAIAAATAATAATAAIAAIAAAIAAASAAMAASAAARAASAAAAERAAARAARARAAARAERAAERAAAAIAAASAAVEAETRDRFLDRLWNLYHGELAT